MSELIIALGYHNYVVSYIFWVVYGGQAVIPYKKFCALSFSKQQ